MVGITATTTTRIVGGSGMVVMTTGMAEEIGTVEEDGIVAAIVGVGMMAGAIVEAGEGRNHAGKIFKPRLCRYSST